MASAGFSGGRVVSFFCSTRKYSKNIWNNNKNSCFFQANYPFFKVRGYSRLRLKIVFKNSCGFTLCFSVRDAVASHA